MCFIFTMQSSHINTQLRAHKQSTSKPEVPSSNKDSNYLRGHYLFILVYLQGIERQYHKK